MLGGGGLDPGGGGLQQSSNAQLPVAQLTQSSQCSAACCLASCKTARARQAGHTSWQAAVGAGCISAQPVRLCRYVCALWSIAGCTAKHNMQCGTDRCHAREGRELTWPLVGEQAVGAWVGEAPAGLLSQQPAGSGSDMGHQARQDIAAT